METPPDDHGNDTIEVRPDERLDEQRLAGFLRGRLDGSESTLEVRQFGNGAANLTYELGYGEHAYVLRRPPLGPVAPSSHDMQREYRVLSVLHEAFPFAPRALLCCDDTEVIGAPFFVMERRRGIVVRRSMPVEYSAAADAPHKMSMALVEALADLHAVDYGELGLNDLGRPEGYLERQVGGWKKRWDAAKAEDLEVMDDVHGWLCDHLPTESAAALVHNDYKLDNTMFAADDPGRMVAVFDWDMCTLGDPLCDLGSLLAYWTEPDDPPHTQMIAVMPVGDERFPKRRELVERYERRSGREATNVGFYHVLGLFRLVVIAAQIYIRFKRGQTQDQRFEMLGPVIELIARNAEEVAARS